MRNFLFCVCLIFLSFPAFSQNLKSTCVRYDVEFQCMDFGNDLFSYTLNDLNIGKDFVYFQYKTQSEMTVNNSSKSGTRNPNTDSQRSRDFGEGIAFAFSAFFEMLPNLTFDAQLVKDNFTAIDSRIDEINAIDKSEVNRALNSLPDIFKFNNDSRLEIEKKLQLKDEEFLELNKKLDQLCQKMDCGQGEKPTSGVETRQKKYQINNDLLSNKRDELQRTRESSSLPVKTIDNIYVSSGILQSKANEAYQNHDLETAESVQTIATQIVNFGLDLTPIASDIKGLYEAIVGENPITSEKLGATERTLSAFTSVIGIASLGTMGAASKAALKSAAILDSFAGAKSALIGASKIMNKMSEIGINKISKAKEFISTSIGKTWLKVQSTGKIFTDSGYKVFDNSSQITNAFPSNGTFARVLQKENAELFKQGSGTLSQVIRDPETGLHIKEAFITTADELKGLSSDEIVKKLSLFSDKEGTIARQLTDNHVVVEFRLKDDFFQSISSPIESNFQRHYGFVPGGKTGGGASEWLIDSEAGIKGYIDLESVVIREIK